LATTVEILTRRLGRQQNTQEQADFHLLLSIQNLAMDRRLPGRQEALKGNLMNSNGHKRILIVDDEESIRTLLKHTFEERDDYHAVTVPDGLIAIDLLSRQRFDLVLTDWRMGDMDGLELARIIRDIRPDTRILLMTGNATPEFASAIESLELNGWIKKPFTLSHVLNMVEQVIG
jgi:CheY-like chemotaxis protein